MGTGGRKWRTDLPQLVAELTATSAVKNWKQPKSRIQNVIKIRIWDGQGSPAGAVEKSGTSYQQHCSDLQTDLQTD